MGYCSDEFTNLISPSKAKTVGFTFYMEKRSGQVSTGAPMCFRPDMINSRCLALKLRGSDPLLDGAPSKGMPFVKSESAFLSFLVNLLELRTFPMRR